VSDPDYSELAARVLAGRPDEARAPRVDRDRGISVIAQAMAERTRRRRARRAWFGSLAATAVVALVAGAWLRFGSPSAAERAVCGADCDAGLTGYAGHASFPPGSHWTAGNDGLRVGFGRVTRLDLEPSSEVLYKSAEGTRRFRLLRGALHARVEKLARGQRFIVETQDTEVEVRGTAFDVAIAPTPKCGTSTRVTVHEGVVEVRAASGTQRLRVGESWPTACDEAAPDPEPGLAASPVSVAVPAPRPKSGARALNVQSPSLAETAKAAPEAASPPEAQPSAAASAPRPPRSSLVEQNDLYARAVAARRSGQPSLALELYAELTRRFPASALVESALIERVRILQKLDPSGASTEARTYLRRFPNGFARDEARAIVEP
jgi:hypothetical protein